MLVTSSSQEISKYSMFAATFYWDYPPLHQSSAELVLCGHKAVFISAKMIVKDNLTISCSHLMVKAGKILMGASITTPL